jgi:hypothetical protein
MDESGSDKEDAEAIEETLGDVSGDDSAAPAPVDSTAEHVLENDNVARRLSSIAMESRMRRVRRVSFDFELEDNVDLHSNHLKDAWVGSSTIYLTESSTGSFVDVSETNSQPGTPALDFSSTMATDSASVMDNQWATATSQPSESAADFPQAPIGEPLPLPTDPPLGVVPTPTDGTQTTDHTIVGTPVPAQAPVKTGPPKASCTPSPTSSLAPTASECPSFFSHNILF